ncbi:hypothetical protein N431DRAFT_557358 [Stipitochalara longipes BDJ]|nr:hypothetical protein N431DRAFT_557358 [Stipitochalara longipes BDJ]
MERLSANRPYDAAYEKVAVSDHELDSDDGSITPTTTVPIRTHSLRRRKRDKLLSTLWLCTRILFLGASIAAWATSLWVTHLASRELGRARSLITDVGPSSSPECIKENPPVPHDTLTSSFILGGTLPVPGYGLVYNTSYCNGWADPEGAKARGCVLDSSQGGWIHELCHDPALLDEWLKLPDFGWYDEYKHPISQERLWAGDIPGGPLAEFYTSKNFHVQHCKFVMKLRIKNGMRKNRGLGYIPLDPGHMNHCVELMTAPKPDPKELTKVVFGQFGGGTAGFGLASECYMPLL